MMVVTATRSEHVADCASHHRVYATALLDNDWSGCRRGIAAADATLSSGAGIRRARDERLRCPGPC